MPIKKEISVDIYLDIDDIIGWVDCDASKEEIEKLIDHIDDNYLSSERIIKLMESLPKSELDEAFELMKIHFPNKQIHNAESLEDVLKVELIKEAMKRFTIQELENRLK